MATSISASSASYSSAIRRALSSIPILWTRSALRLELGLAPLYHCDYIIRVHRTYFAFFFAGGCFGGSLGSL